MIKATERLEPVSAAHRETDDRVEPIAHLTDDWPSQRKRNRDCRATDAITYGGRSRNWLRLGLLTSICKVHSGKRSCQLSDQCRL